MCLQRTPARAGRRWRPGALARPPPRTTASTTATSPRASTGRTTRRSRSPRTSASRSTWPCCPTAGSCTPPATATSGSPTPTPAPRRSSTPSPVYSNSEDGLQTITLDPDFADNQWVYLYYAPRTMTAPYPTTTPTGSAPNTPAGRRRRVLLGPVEGLQPAHPLQVDPRRALDLATEQVIIKVEVQRGQCCHVAGDVDFDDDGNLYLSTGDNTPASAPGANGYAPNNDAPGFNPGFDSRRGAGNTNDLRGKILRINVAGRRHATRSPRATCFAPGTAKTRPEIFVMGVRNPFRMDVDPATELGLVGRLRPRRRYRQRRRAARWATSSGRPRSTSRSTAAGRTARANANYNDWDFATATPGECFDCAAGAENNSRWNTGLHAAAAGDRAATLYYGDQPTPPAVARADRLRPAGGQAPMGGPIYHYDEENPSTTKFPEYWDGKAFMAEFSQDYVFAFSRGRPRRPVVTKIEDFLPNAALDDRRHADLGQPDRHRVRSRRFALRPRLRRRLLPAEPRRGPLPGRLHRGQQGRRAPTSTASVTSGHGPLEVDFSAAGSTHPEDVALSYAWDLDGNGTFDRRACGDQPHLHRGRAVHGPAARHRPRRTGRASPRS